MAHALTLTAETAPLSARVAVTSQNLDSTWSPTVELYQTVTHCLKRRSAMSALMGTPALSARMAIGSKMANVRHVIPIRAPSVMKLRGTVTSAKKATIRTDKAIACGAEKVAKIAGTIIVAVNVTQRCIT